MILFTVTTKQDRWRVLWTCEDSKVKEKGLQGQKRETLHCLPSTLNVFPFIFGQWVWEGVLCLCRA